MAESFDWSLTLQREKKRSTEENKKQKCGEQNFKEVCDAKKKRQVLDLLVDKASSLWKQAESAR